MEVGKDLGVVVGEYAENTLYGFSKNVKIYRFIVIN